MRAAVRGDRDGVVVALAREQDELRRADAARMKAYALAAEPYLEAFGRLDPLSAGSRRRILAS